MNFNPDDSVGQQLTQNLATELKNRFGIDEDAGDIAEFIVILMASNRQPGEILSEIKSITDIPIEESFITLITNEAARLVSEAAGEQPKPQPSQPLSAFAQPTQPQSAFTQPQVSQPTQPQVSQPQVSQPPTQPLSAFNQPQSAFNSTQPAFYQPQSAFLSAFPSLQSQQQSAFPSDPPFQSQQQSSFPSDPPAYSSVAGGSGSQPRQVRIPEGPKSLMSRTSERSKLTGRGGIAKGPSKASSRDYNSRPLRDSSSGPKSYAIRNPQNLEKMLNLPNNNINLSKSINIPKGRCKEFPNCKKDNCEFAHPTRNCFNYPNCPNPPGTCNFIHPDEDEELINKLAKSRQEYAEKKQLEITIQSATCKFGKNCVKDTCPFVHPTPANPDAIIKTLDWCSSGKNCSDTNCEKSHPPPPNAKINSIDPNQIALEQCKFGATCSNYKCTRRHATSIVPCRAGSDCKRLDCYYSHPIPEQCRFGEKCTNKNCLFQHPPTRTLPATSWSKDSASNNLFTFTAPSTTMTTNRSFAVPDDQVMEQAVQD